MHLYEGVLDPASPFVGLIKGNAPARWQFNTDHAEAIVQTDTAPGSITIYGGNDVSGGDTDYTTDAMDTHTTRSFDWTYFSVDDPGFDSFGILVNGEYSRLTNDDVLFGSYSLILDTGDAFGFRVHTVDGAKGAGIATIYNFHVKEDIVPESSTGLLLMLGITVVLTRRQTAWQQ